MAVSINGTTLTFNDSTTQTTARTASNTVTSVTGAGTVSVSASTGAVTITGTGSSGTVTSVATGNGLSGGTITGSGTLEIAAPSYNSVGSYCNGILTGSAASGNTNYAAGTGSSQMQGFNIDACGQPTKTNNFSGTWKAMCGSSGVAQNSGAGTIFVRVS